MSTLTDAAPAGATGAATELTYREAINAALDDAMAADDAVLLMGEDVDADGGVFKTNIGLRREVRAGARPEHADLRERVHRASPSG